MSMVTALTRCLVLGLALSGSLLAQAASDGASFALRCGKIYTSTSAAPIENGWLVVRDGTEVHVVPVDRLDYAEAQGDYVALWSGERSWLKQQTMQALEARLDPARFEASQRDGPGVDPALDGAGGALVNERRLFHPQIEDAHRADRAGPGPGRNGSTPRTVRRSDRWLR